MKTLFIFLITGIAVVGCAEQPAVPVSAKLAAAAAEATAAPEKAVANPVPPPFVRAPVKPAEEEFETIGALGPNDPPWQEIRAKGKEQFRKRGSPREHPEGLDPESLAAGGPRRREAAQESVRVAAEREEKALRDADRAHRARRKAGRNKKALQ